MKFLISVVLLFCCTFIKAQSPLSSYSNEWNDAMYTKANTVAEVTYMTSEEKKVIHIMNLMRMNPSLFLRTVVMKYPSISIYNSLEKSSYFLSLIEQLKIQKSLAVLLPDERNFNSAFCHAKTSGEKSYVGHERLTNECKKKQFFAGECCSYGYDNAIDIVLTLLIDKDVPSLGHRYALLSDQYKTCGVSIQPHKTYRFNAVLDFMF